jgi:acyl-CoA thioester hydrolase
LSDASLSTEQLEGIEVVRGKVLPEWIDVNKHMNVAYYVLAFDLAVDSLWEVFGITESHVNVSSSSTFAVENHITWQRELAEDEPYIITSQLLAYDEKRIHQFMRMYHAKEGFLASTAEWLNLHVDLKTRRVAPWPDSVRDQIAAFSGRQQDWEWPSEAGRQMTVPKPIYAAPGRP